MTPAERTAAGMTEASVVVIDECSADVSRAALLRRINALAAEPKRQTHHIYPINPQGWAQLSAEMQAADDRRYARNKRKARLRALREGKPIPRGLKNRSVFG